jgi:phosphate transport system protein
MMEHTSKDFRTELKTLRERLMTMGRRAEEQLVLALRALADRDDAVARLVIENDQLIDRDEREIDALAFLILATRQPVASDLRLITTSLKLVVDLERIGDLASGIAKRALELNRLSPLDAHVDPARLAALVQKNLHAALDAFVQEDAAAATAVIAADAEIDVTNASLFSELLARVATDPEMVTRVLPLTSVCRYLERIGDHVKNLGEEVVYMVRATDLRHQPLPDPSN